MNIDFTEALKITQGHIVQNFVTMRTYCGVDGFGWNFGSIRDANCTECLKIFATY